MNPNTKIVEIKNVSVRYKIRDGFFKYSEVDALDEVTLNIHQKDRLAIIGLNGSGKSTLLKVINKLIEPTNGTVSHTKSLKISLLTIGLGFNPTLTGRDNALISLMIYGFSKKEANSKLSEIKEFSELNDFFEKPIRTYSSGMKARLGFAVASNTDVDLLLVDEAMATGDKNFRKKALKKVEEFLMGNKSLVLVSHSMNQINTFCESAIWMRNGNIHEVGDVETLTKRYSTTL